MFTREPTINKPLQRCKIQIFFQSFKGQCSHSKCDLNHSFIHTSVPSSPNRGSLPFTSQSSRIDIQRIDIYKNFKHAPRTEKLVVALCIFAIMRHLSEVSPLVHGRTYRRYAATILRVLLILLQSTPEGHVHLPARARDRQHPHHSNYQCQHSTYQGCIILSARS